MKKRSVSVHDQDDRIMCCLMNADLHLSCIMMFAMQVILGDGAQMTGTTVNLITNRSRNKKGSKCICFRDAMCTYCVYTKTTQGGYRILTPKSWASYLAPRNPKTPCMKSVRNERRCCVVSLALFNP